VDKEILAAVLGEEIGSLAVVVVGLQLLAQRVAVRVLR
jgi:hypothetical protein